MTKKTAHDKKKPTKKPVEKRPKLAALAKQIVACHHKARSAEWRCLPDACKTGVLLNKVKGQLEHGEWGPWVTRNCKFKIREAQRYMFIADHADEIQAFRTDAKKPSLREALARLVAKRQPGGDDEPLTFTEVELEEANKEPVKPELEPDSAEHKFVETEADRVIRQVIKIASKKTLKAPGGEAVTPALAVVTLLDLIRSALEPKRVVRVAAAIAEPPKEGQEEPAAEQGKVKGHHTRKVAAVKGRGR